MKYNDPFNIDDLDGYQFEELVAKIMKKKGYRNIKITSKSKDMGKDIVMESLEKEIVLVECKHQRFVGRPVTQKLQGAINFEETKNPNRDVKGIVVTSGKFSKEAKDYNKRIGNDIELIDGNKLKEICKKLDIFILNGKVQIINNQSFKFIKPKEVKESILKKYSRIYWSKTTNPKIISKLVFIPACFLKYKLNFETHTSVGCVDTYSDSGKILIDGVTGEDIDEDIAEFYFSGKIESEELDRKYSDVKSFYEFTENDIEEYAIQSIMEEHTHSVTYTGNNNVTYTKKCIPKKRDIDIIEFVPVYLPFWSNKINIINMNYQQDFYSKGNKQFIVQDELKKCKICEKEENNYEDLKLCPVCGRIVCDSHTKIDYLDEKTPVCDLHVKSFKLLIQIKHFATNENKRKYKEWWSSQGFFQRLWEDKIASWLIIGIIFL